MFDLGVWTDWLEAMRAAWETGGGIAVLATFVLFAIRLFRTDLVQSMLPIPLQWGQWPGWLKWLAPFGLAAIGTVLLDLQAGLEPWQAIANGFAAAVAATAGHGVTKAAGRTEQAARLKRDPMYQPGVLRKAAGLVLPIRAAKDYYQGKR